MSGPDGFGRSRPGDDRPTDCDRHPGVDTSVGPSPQRASAVFPLDVKPEARAPVTIPAVDPSRPIAPADQPARLDALEAAIRARSDIVPKLRNLGTHVQKLRFAWRKAPALGTC